MQENELLEESHSKQSNIPSGGIKCREWIIKRVESNNQGNLHAKKRVWVTGGVHSKKQTTHIWRKPNGENGLQENYTVRTRETDPLR